MIKLQPVTLPQLMKSIAPPCQEAELLVKLQFITSLSPLTKTALPTELLAKLQFTTVPEPILTAPPFHAKLLTKLQFVIVPECMQIAPPSPSTEATLLLIKLQFSTVPLIPYSLKT